MEIRITSLDTIAQSALQFIAAIGQARVIAFYGQMGAGKTTFIKAICQVLGVTEPVTSPTFAIVNEYATSPSGTLQGAPVYHFDFYRIKRLAEVYDMGYEEYFYSGALCLIEWPELIEELLPDDALRVTITEEPDGTRLIKSRCARSLMMNDEC